MQDFIDMLTLLNLYKVQYIVVGSFAMAHFGYIRATGDIDIFVEPNSQNSKRVFDALSQFGAPCLAHGIAEDYFANAGNFYQLGLPPNRIDFLTQISGVDYSTAAQTANMGSLGGEQAHILSLEMLIKNKLAAGREKDILDAAELQKMRPK